MLAAGLDRSLHLKEVCTAVPDVSSSERIGVGVLSVSKVAAAPAGLVEALAGLLCCLIGAVLFTDIVASLFAVLIPQHHVGELGVLAQRLEQVDQGAGAVALGAVRDAEQLRRPVLDVARLGAGLVLRSALGAHALGHLPQQGLLRRLVLQRPQRYPDDIVGLQRLEITF